MANNPTNRLASLFVDFAKNMEMEHNVSDDGSNALLGIPESGKLIQARYAFDPSQASYTLGAPLGEVTDNNRELLSNHVLSSAPMIGMTERIIGDKFVVLSGRDDLVARSDAEIKRGFMDDTARVSSYYNGIKPLFGDDDQ